MNICYINNLFFPYSVGGAEEVVFDLVKKEIKSGNEVVVISWQPWYGWNSWQPKLSIEAEGIKIYRFWVPNIFSYKNLGKHGFLTKLVWHFFDIFNFWSAHIIKSILIKEKSTVVNTHNLMGIGFGVPRLIQKLKIKHLHTVHDVQLIEPSGILSWNHQTDNIWQKIYQRLIRQKMGTPDEVIFLSEFIKDFYLRRNFFKNSLIKIDSPKLFSLSEKNSSHSKIFLFVGSLVKPKGVEILLKAWDKVTDGELRLVGDGNLRKEVENWAKGKNNVKIYGRLTRSELVEIYKKSDVLIFPSICIENRPNVIVEAMQFGLNVIAADTGGVKELITDKNKFVLIEPGNVEQLVEKIKAAL